MTNNVRFEFIIIGIIGGLLLLYITWLSIQSLLQAKLLRTARNRRPLIDSCNAAIAICGPVRISRPITDRGPGGECLWVEEQHEERRGYGKRRKWRTTFRESRIADFTIRVGDEEIALDGMPTEMQGTSMRIDDVGGGGFLSFENPQRVTWTWLPVPANLTALGRLSGMPGQFKLGKDLKVGLVISPHPPEKSAAIEKAKGIGGLFAVGATMVGIIYLCFFHAW